jgi:hypothetical protein
MTVRIGLGFRPRLHYTEISEGCEGSEASTPEEPYRFEENKDCNLRGEIDGNLTNNNQKEGDCILRSLHSLNKEHSRFIVDIGILKGACGSSITFPVWPYTLIP